MKIILIPEFLFLPIFSWCNVCDRYSYKFSYNVCEWSRRSSFTSWSNSDTLSYRMVSHRLSCCYSIWFIACWKRHWWGKFLYYNFFSFFAFAMPTNNNKKNLMNEMKNYKPNDLCHHDFWEQKNLMKFNIFRCLIFLFNFFNF